MDAQNFYIAIETLVKEAVPDGLERVRLLNELEKFRLLRPDNPPAKGLMADVELVISKRLITERHANLIKEIAHYWI
ncbi:MAG: hypothetical protein JSS58_10490 [Proteobacteria bacterium]|nr:hypothetical protein [Pseudomonadota bacterium]